ncbi:protein shisa-like-1a [Phacochoerus africanus]|uniref:protein shisa-like-1a n=1 Tax=Phacochoerus africanus TaxID=41426 RepID=UPI001FDA32CA|nr:protein shisa-like-1a [Phacochoerus africanus]
MGFQKRPGSLLTGLSTGLLLLFSWTTLAQPTSLSALVHYPHLCQTSWDADGRRYTGFFCPRLTDTPEEAYCCHLLAAGGSCCTRAEFEALYQVNLSALEPPPILRGPGPLLALGLYSLLLLALMTADFVHFCRSRGRGQRRDQVPDQGRDAGPGSQERPSVSSAARPLQVSAGTD